MQKESDKTYNLVERTAVFGENVIDLIKSIKPDMYNRLMILQLGRSSGSIGANYCEATNASSKRDFRNKVFICKKEAQETQHWLRMLAKSNPEIKSKIRESWRECHELTLIFQAMINSIKKDVKYK